VRKDWKICTVENLFLLVYIYTKHQYMCCLGTKANGQSRGCPSTGRALSVSHDDVPKGTMVIVNAWAHRQALGGPGRCRRSSGRGGSSAARTSAASTSS
jgi:hypothetical protein